MDTPVCDFVRQYAGENALRLHMPGHKGVPLLGMEPLDITEIDGADSLYEAGGILRKSEENVSALFGCRTYYSTEGSFQCIRAMLYLALLYARKNGRPPLVLAGRNAHKTFLSAAALLDLQVEWICPQPDAPYLCCTPSAEQVEALLRAGPEPPAAVYLTSPDYLGSLADIGPIARVCRRYGTLLLVDNAHGAYLRFLQPSAHPMDLGADLCCDSAHKTLPVLTGGAYLHLSDALPEPLARQARNALALFGSTSPSYLILQSLDRANAWLQENAQAIRCFAGSAQALRQRLARQGYTLLGDEPLKLTLSARPRGYTGRELAQLLRAQHIVAEFADPDYLVLMLAPDTGESGLTALEQALADIPAKAPLPERPPRIPRAERVLSVREAALSPAVELPVEACEGRVLAAASVGCPPAVPVLVCGERISAEAIRCFRYYGVERCWVTDDR